MANPTDNQRKALGIFQLVLTFILELFKATHGKDLSSNDLPPNGEFSIE